MFFKIPSLKEYYPSEDILNIDQSKFYRKVETKLKNLEHISLDGNISYFFIFIYKLLEQYEKIGFEELYITLLRYSELYNYETKISNYCTFWADDCLLGQKKYEEFLEKTEPKYLIGDSTHYSNLRLNIQQHIGINANPIDVLLMISSRRSKFIEANMGIYRDKIIDVFDDYSKQYGGWFKIFVDCNCHNPIYSYRLFQGSTIVENPSLDFNTSCFYSSYDNHYIIKDLAKKAENEACIELGVPKVGENWVSETMLYRQIEKAFPETKVIQHGRPAWLKKQHFDVWLPNWNIALEYQGLQHYQPVEIFGGKEGYERTLFRDIKKKNLCKRHGVKLLEINGDYDIEEIILQIKKAASERNANTSKKLVPKLLSMGLSSVLPWINKKEQLIHGIFW